MTTGDQTGGRRWLTHYASGVLAGAIVAFCLAPTTVMYWQAFVVLHAAVLVVVLWLGALLRTRRAGAIRLGGSCQPASQPPSE